MSLSDRWTLAQIRDSARRELLDTNTRWFSDSELNASISDWQHNLQDEFEFAWGTATFVTSTSTISTTDVATDIRRLDAIYWNNYRLSPRTKIDLEVLYREWKGALASGAPSTVYQDDSRNLVLWPPLSTSGTLTFEYPRTLTFASDATQMQIPAWTRYSAVPYVCYRAYLRDGPNNSIEAALRYKTKFARQLQLARTFYTNYFPFHYPSLRPGNKYEYDILIPKSAGDVTLATMPTATFTEYTPTGTIDGVNVTFTVPVVPVEIQLFKNNGLVIEGLDYSITSSTITFNPSAVPQTGDTLRAWVFRT